MLVVQSQLEIINEQIKLKERLRYELEQLRTLLLYNQDIGADQLLKILEVIRMNESNYLTPEQVEKMKVLTTAYRRTKVRDAKELALHGKNATASFTENDPEITKAGERFHAAILC